MAAMAVTSTPVKVPTSGSGALILQNAGAAPDGDSIFFDSDSDVDETTGIELAAGETFEYTRSGFGSVYVMSTGTADLRWISY